MPVRVFLDGSAFAQHGLHSGKIYPESSTITGPNGERYLALPLRFYTEYGVHSTESDPGPLGKIDMDVDRYTLGADFVTSSFWFWGGAVSFVETEVNGSGPFAPSLVTEKDVEGGAIYVDKLVRGRFRAGGLAYYNTADGMSVFNFADVVRDDTDIYGYGPYINYAKPLSGCTVLIASGILTVNHLDADYVGNIPPTADLTNVVAQFPVTLTHRVAPRLSVSGQTRLNWIVDQETFPNVPEPDRTTLTLGAGAEFDIGRGVSMYGRVSHDFFDDAYDQTHATVGLAVNPQIFFARERAVGLK